MKHKSEDYKLSTLKEQSSFNLPEEHSSSGTVEYYL
jgi:hypothetical protein